MVETNPAPEIRFRSKKDGWISLLFFGSILLVVWGAFQEPNQPVSATFEIGLKVFAGLFVAFMLWVYYDTCYLLTGTELKVRSGPLRTKILLSTIESVEPTRSPLSSPALSMDRLRIRHDRYGFTMISPEDRAGFLMELTRRSPSLRPTGSDKLARVATESD